MSGLAETGSLTGLRTQTFMPWFEKPWDTPNVAHDNPKAKHFHPLILGFADQSARAAFFESRDLQSLSGPLASFASALHACDVSAAMTYVEDGHILPLDVK